MLPERSVEEGLLAAIVMFGYAIFIYRVGSESIEKDVANEVLTRVFIPIALASFPLLAFGLHWPAMTSFGLGLNIVAYAGVVKAKIFGFSRDFPLIPKAIVRYGWLYSLVCIILNYILSDQIVSSALFVNLVLSILLLALATYQLRKSYGYYGS